MESSSSPGVGIPESSLDFSFGFDDATYSDRTLQLEIADAESEPHAEVNATAVVKTIHINSLILAARSQFFRKLFSNGMLESGQKLVTLRIQNSEEDSLIDLLKYAYSNNLPTTFHTLLDLLVIADKFEVASCSRDCTQLLQNLPMTCESASLYLDLPPSLQTSPTVEPLIDAAKQFLVAHFKDFNQCNEEMLNLPLASIRVILSSDDLQVTSEGVVFESVLTWARKHYPDLEERREILKIHLLDLIRFPFMSILQLTERVQTCSDIDRELANQIVIRALSFKAETPHRKRCLATEEVNVVSRQFVERAYKSRAIKVKVVESPHQHCLIFLHLTRKELRGIFPDGEIMSESFHLGKQELVFVGRCYLITKTHNFCLALKVVGSPAPTPVKYEVAIRKKPLVEYVSWTRGSYAFTEHLSVLNLIDFGWTGYMSDDNSYFINDVQYVRIELTTKK
ncbi:hypothetical protein ACS0TY_001147 [Phlomoides rotata]